MTKKELKDNYIKLLKWQKSKRVIAEYSIQEIEDGRKLRVGVQPLKPPHFVYLELNTEML